MIAYLVELFSSLNVRRGPLFISLAIHLALAAVAFSSWQSSKPEKRITPPRYIEAKLVKLKTEAKKPTPKKQSKKVDLTKKQSTSPPKKTAPAKKKEPDLEKKKKEKAKLEAEKREREAKRLRDLEQQRVLTELEKSLKQEEQAIAEEQQANEAQSYKSVIFAKVRQNWSRPPSARNGMQVELLIQLVPTGRVVSVSIIKSSGNSAFDRSAVQAVKRAEVFPELKAMSPQTFEKYYRQFNLLFNPQDLRQ